jgi:cAMP phosphodiesterase
MFFIKQFNKVDGKIQIKSSMCTLRNNSSHATIKGNVDFDFVQIERNNQLKERWNCCRSIINHQQGLSITPTIRPQQ